MVIWGSILGEERTEIDFKHGLPLLFIIEIYLCDELTNSVFEKLLLTVKCPSQVYYGL